MKIPQLETKESSTIEDWFKQYTSSELQELRLTLHEPMYNAKHVPLTNRMINHWHEKDLFLYKRDSEKWRKFSIAEFIWVLFLVRLRNIGVGLDVIEKVKNQARKSTFQRLKDKVTIELIAGPIDKSEGTLKVYDLVTKEENRMKKLLSEVPFQEFSFHLGLSIISGYDVLIEVRPEAEQPIYFEPLIDVNVHSFGPRMLQRGSVFMGMNTLVNEFYNTPETKWEEKIPLDLTKGEKEVIQQIRSGQYKQIEVHFKNKELSHLKSKEPMVKMDEQKFYNQVLQRKYVNIRVIKREEDSIHVEVEKVTKF